MHQQNFNFADYAKLYGGEGITVEQAKDIEASIIQTKKSKKPFILHAVVNSGELSLPPHIGAKEIMGFWKI